MASGGAKVDAKVLPKEKPWPVWEPTLTTETGVRKAGSHMTRLSGVLTTLVAVSALGSMLGAPGVFAQSNAPKAQKTLVASTYVRASKRAEHSQKKTRKAGPIVHLLLTVKTGGMLHHPGYPEIQVNGKFAPTFVLPAHSKVVVKLVSYDSGSAPVPKIYGTVTGTVGGRIVVDGKPTKSIAPKDVAHTFTVGALGLNIPIPIVPKGKRVITETFAFFTKGPGHDTWQCMAPCGSGAAGWGGPMVKAGYMMGHIVIH